jgi:hypothetical protein
MGFHSLLTYFLAALGLFTGVSALRISGKFSMDWLLRAYFIMLGILNIYTGIIYTLIILGIISAIPPTQSSIFMRPANVLFLVMPYVISMRMVKK